MPAVAMSPKRTIRPVPDKFLDKLDMEAVEHNQIVLGSAYISSMICEIKAARQKKENTGLPTELLDVLIQMQQDISALQRTITDLLRHE